MTTARSTRKRRHPAPAGYWDDDLVSLDPDSPFTKTVKELRAFIAGAGKPLEEWDEADFVELRRRSEGDAFAIAAAVAAPGGPDGVTSEDPHRVFDHNA